MTKYNNDNKTLGTPYEGQQLGEIWGYVVDGLFKTDEEAENYPVNQSYVNNILNISVKSQGPHAGDVKYVDLDGDNIISPTLSANDVKDQKVIGNSLPRYTYSVRLAADWNGIDFLLCCKASVANIGIPMVKLVCSGVPMPVLIVLLFRRIS